MHESIVKFRKNVDQLIKEDGWNLNEIAEVTQFCYTTLTQLLEQENFPIHASTLGKIQDFNGKCIRMELINPSYQTPIKETPEPITDNSPLTEQEEKDAELFLGMLNSHEWFMLLKQLYVTKPKDVQITITF